VTAVLVGVAIAWVDPETGRIEGTLRMGAEPLDLIDDR